MVVVVPRSRACSLRRSLLVASSRLTAIATIPPATRAATSAATPTRRRSRRRTAAGTDSPPMATLPSLWIRRTRSPRIPHAGGSRAIGAVGRRTRAREQHGPRMIVGWRVASNMKTEMVLDALEMARRSRGARRLVGLVTHSDAGSQFTSVRFTERLDEIGARPSIGTVADSYDNALAETTNGLYKTECVYGPDAPRPWEDVDELELATLSWVHWFNEDRLHGHCDDVPPAEFEAAFYAAHQTDPAGVGNQ